MALYRSCHRGVPLLLYVFFILHEGVALNLQNKDATQLQTATAEFPQHRRLPSLAIDGNLGTFSHTAFETDPWWRVDLGETYCLRKITVVNRQSCCESRLEDGIVRAGLSEDHTQNAMIGSQVTATQATNSGFNGIDFIADPIVSARYVSVELHKQEFLHIAEVIVEEVVDIEQPPVDDVALNLLTKAATQSSIYTGRPAGNALDGDRNTIAQTNRMANSWWRVDLDSIYCLAKVIVVNRNSYGSRLRGTIVRAGLSEDHSQNAMIGSQVTPAQATNGAVIDFIADPVVSARYVSAELQRSEYLTLAEVMVEISGIDEMDSLDVTVVANPALLGPTGDNNAVMTAYIGPNDIVVGVVFGRQLTTGGSNDGLPSGSSGTYDPTLGCRARLLSLPEDAGIDRTGVYYAEATKNCISTRIKIVILPENDNNLHTRPVQRTQVANIGDPVTLEMQYVNSPNTNYRWRHDGGDVMTTWNGMLSVTLSDVTLTDEGVYSCFADGQEDQQRHGFMRLIVRGCRSDMWGLPSCSNVCRRCYNGGICDDKTGTCICAPGFSGENCGQVHGRHVFGQNASQSCSGSSDPHNDACQGRLFCLPDPYGCSCAAGYTGLDCMQECNERMYGADCKQTCHCASGVTCKQDTGECEGNCASQYTGPNCQCQAGNTVLGLQITSIDLHQLSITWQPDFCVSSYKLQYELTHRGQCEGIQTPQRVTVSDALSGQTTNQLITGLESNSTYVVYIRPQYDRAQGPEVSVSEITQRRNDYRTVSTLTVTTASSDSLTMGWFPVLCAYHYNVEYAVTNIGGCESVDPLTYIQHCSCTGNITTVSGLIPNSMYRVQVKAFAYGLFGPITTEDFLTATSEPSEPPDEVQVESVRQRSLRFSWSEPPCGVRGGIITGYVYVLRRLDSETINSMNGAAASDKAVTIDTLIPFSIYSFHVAANTSAGTGPYSERVTAETLEAEPTVPLNVAILNVDDVSIGLQWSKPDPPQGIITHYNVRHWRDGQMQNSTVDYNLMLLIHHILDLETNVNYHVQVQAVTSVGAGNWSEAVNAITKIGVPGPVGNLRPTERMESSITLGWNEPLQPRGAIMNYTVEYRILEKPYQPDFTAEEAYVTESVTSATFTADNLNPSTKYEFSVAAKNQLYTGTPQIVLVYTKPKSDISPPQTPKLYENEVTDTTVTIGLAALISPDEYITSYVVHVKKTSSRKKRGAFKPKHYKDSANEYIAAELSKMVEGRFVVGDSKIYRDYYNAPLQTGANYEISVGSVSMGNETEVNVKYSTPISVKAVMRRSALSAGVVAAIVLVVIVICIGFFVLLVVYKRRRSSHAKQSSNADGVLQSTEIPLETKEMPVESSPNTYIDDGAVEVTCTPPTPKKPKPVPKLRQTSNEKQLHEKEEKKGAKTFTQPAPVHLSELAEYIRAKESAADGGFNADYKTLPDDQLHPWTVAAKPENKPKNRYKNVVAYDYSRVVLEPLESAPHSDYINACYIDGYNEKDKYIASQGPNKASLHDIWRMVWQQDVDKIVMLTNPVENGKTKCLQYWADTGSETFSDIVVSTFKEDVFLDYTIRVFSINKVGSEENGRIVKQFHYTTWPDMKPPEYPAPLLNFLRLVNAERNQGRTVVHCSAGVGRTGTYIALDSMLKQMKQEGQVDVLGFVYQMRQKRIKMVQTAEQYKFIFDALLAAHLAGHTTYKITDFHQEVTALKKMEKGSKETGTQRQFEMLAALGRRSASDSTKSGQLPENVDKNRFPDFIPTDRARPFLTTRVHEDDTNYMNANCLPGYRKKNKYIATQTPMPNTVADIWRLVFDQKSTCIVMLNTLDANDKTVRCYWPEEGSIEFGPLVVELTETTEYRGVTCRTFTLFNKNATSDAERTVTQFQYHDWPSDEEVPRSMDGMLILMELTLKCHGDAGPIVVHCNDGLGSTAVYCTLMAIMEQYQAEKAVDIFQTVHRLRMVNHNMMYSLDQYKMCYDVFQAYLDSSSLYVNYSPMNEIV